MSVHLFALLLSNVHIFIGTPAYDGKVSHAYADALLETERLLNTYEYRMTVRFLARNIVTRARNILAHEFLENDQYTHLLFIDADIVWHPRAIVTLLSHNKDAVIAFYANKHYDWNKLPALSQWELLSSSSQLAHYPMQTDTNGLAEVQFAATGFMLLKRNVLQQLSHHVPTFRCPYNNSMVRMRVFFDCNVVDGEYLTEDYYFSHLWRNKFGGKIFGDAKIQLGHEGFNRFGSVT